MEGSGPPGGGKNKMTESHPVKGKGQELSKEEKLRLRKEKKQQKKNKEKAAAVDVVQDGAVEKTEVQPHITAPVPPVPPTAVGPTPEAPPAGKSKAEQRAERRAKQEAERAQKQSKKTEQGGGPAPSKPKSQPSESQTVKRLPEHIQVDDPAAQKKLAKKLERQQLPEVL